MTQDHTDAMIWNDRSFSWQLLDSYIHSTSRRLKEIGIKPGARVLVEAIPSASTVIVFLSLWRINAIACPFDPRLTDALAQDARSKCDPYLVLVKSASDKMFGNLRALTISDMICVEPVEQFFAGALPVRKDLMARVAQDATIIFTSGSTGGQKAVLHSIDAHFFNAQGAASVIPFQSGDRWLMSLPLYRISGIAVIFRALYGGGSMIFSDLDLAQAILKYKPTHISLVPAQFLRLLDILTQEDWACFKTILIGGAPVPERLMKKAEEFNLPVFVTYGMTETASQIATSPLAEARRYGARILPSREVIVIDHEICIKGPVLFKGYIKGESITLPVDENGWFHTGDLGEGSDYLRVSGRRDRMFISGGENIFPELIEKALLNLEYIVYAKVESKEDELFGKVAIASIILREGVSFNESEAKAMLKLVLLPFQIPKEFIIIQQQPVCLKSAA